MVGNVAHWEATSRFSSHRRAQCTFRGHKVIILMCGSGVQSSWGVASCSRSITATAVIRWRTHPKVSRLGSGGY